MWNALDKNKGVKLNRSTSISRKGTDGIMNWAHGARGWWSNSGKQKQSLTANQGALGWCCQEKGCSSKNNNGAVSCWVVGQHWGHACQSSKNNGIESFQAELGQCWQHPTVRVTRRTEQRAADNLIPRYAQLHFCIIPYMGMYILHSL